MGEHEGLDIIQGEVVQFDRAQVDKIPQIGWNSVSFQNTHHFLVEGIPNHSYFYFVHSYHAVPDQEEVILGKTTYGEVEFCAMVAKGNVFATQFHPEKSSERGIQMYRNFINHCT